MSPPWRGADTAETQSPVGHVPPVGGCRRPWAPCSGRGCPLRGGGRHCGDATARRTCPPRRGVPEAMGPVQRAWVSPPWRGADIAEARPPVGHVPPVGGCRRTWSPCSGRGCLSAVGAVTARPDARRPAAVLAKHRGGRTGLPGTTMSPGSPVQHPGEKGRGRAAAHPARVPPWRCGWLSSSSSRYRPNPPLARRAGLEAEEGKEEPP